MSSIVNDLVDPILSNPDNYSSWPKVVSADVRSHVQKLKNEVYEITGSVKGRTMLPMPAGVDNINAEGNFSLKNANFGPKYVIFRLKIAHFRVRIQISS